MNTNTLTFAVSVEKRTLLVPLSKMIVRDCFNTELVLPLTDRLGEVSSQVAPAETAFANTGVPISGRLVI